jgi:holo-[acyl-carrier protein] synthase
MIVATGIDLIEVSRIRQVFERRGTRFRDRVFTENEIAYCEGRGSKFESYAARFAAKEALFKALGTGWGDGVAWREVEVIRGEKGAPSIRLTGRALECFNQLGARRAHLSLSHSGDIAIAQVVLEA